MNYENSILVRLSDSVFRAEIFDGSASESCIQAAYDVADLVLEDPYQPVFDEVQLGFAVPRFGKMEGTWRPVSGGEQVEAKFQLSGIGDNDLIRVDAFWKGAIVARFAPTNGRITQVETVWTELSSIDAEIMADLGALPDDATILEQERRNRLIAKVRTGFDQPNLFSGENLDSWLNRIGAESVGQLLTEFWGTAQATTMQVTFAELNDALPSPKRFPITAAILIRNEEFSLTQLLVESKWIREHLDSFGFENIPVPTLKPRHSILIVWILPEVIFDDADWPGGSESMEPSALRQARRAIASQWLAREGIALVTTPP